LLRRHVCLNAKPLLVAGALVFVLASSPASADWQGTVWNSSVEQADKDFRVPHRPPTSAEISNLSDAFGGGEIKFAFDYTTGDLAFHHGALLFRDGKLHAISMRLIESAHCDKLIGILRRIYGPPAKEQEGPRSSQRITWYDEKNHNQVYLGYEKYTSVDDYCYLRYEPFIVPAPGQL